MVTIAKQSPWEIQRSVIFALFVRELNTRFGRFRLGYLWAILEPLAIVVILSSVRVFLGRTDIAGLPYPVFFASGIIAYLMFQHIVSSSLNAVESNIGLFNYQRVKPFDVFTARAMLELLIALGTAAAIFPGLYLVGYTFTWNSTLMVIAVVGTMFLMSCGLGLICAIIGPLWQESKKTVPVMIRPLFFISGIFFPASAVPPGIRDYAMINPLLHFTDLIRGAMFSQYTSHEGSLYYVTCWAMGCLLVGLFVYRRFRVTVVTSGNIR